MEPQPSGTNITWVSSVGEKRREFLLWTRYCTNCHSAASTCASTRRPDSSSCPGLSFALRGKPAREKKREHGWPVSGLEWGSHQSYIFSTVCFELWWLWNGPVVMW